MAKATIANAVLPNPPVPSQVRMSAVPDSPLPTAKMVDGREVEVKEEPDFNEEGGIVEDVGAEKFGADGYEKPKGIITIKTFENSAYEVSFEGHITGSEIDIAWKAMMRQYRGWKASQVKPDIEKDGVV